MAHYHYFVHKLTPAGCCEWARMPYWTMLEAILLSMGYNPRDNNLDLHPDVAEKIGIEQEKRYEIIARSEFANEDKKAPVAKGPRDFVPAPGNECVFNPASFTKWAVKCFPSYPDDLLMAVKDFYPKDFTEDQTPEGPEDTDQSVPVGKKTEPSLRKNQRHKERCRAIAELLWFKNSSTTIADMILCNEIVTYGCEGKLYNEKVMRSWINDLAPNRDPGRRPEEKNKAE